MTRIRCKYMNLETDKLYSSLLQEDEFLRQRIQPRPGDNDYLHLSDLRMALDEFKTTEKLLLLDFGCGGSPYRTLFPNADYRRADFEAMEALDYIINHDSKVNEQSEIFDLILSTQVVEHVTNSAKYFSECFRLLKPGGLLICSTHGTFPDHGSPYDYQRWTASGLQRDIEKAGFLVEKMAKLTTGPRAILYLTYMHLWQLSALKSTLLGFSMALLKRLLVKFKKSLDRQFDDFYAVNRVTHNLDFYTHSMYICLFAIARKPLGISSKR